MRLLRNNTWNGVPPGGFFVSQGGTNDLVGIPENMKNVISGIPILDHEGMVKPSDVPIAYLGYTPNIEGPLKGIFGATLVYTITNYSFIRKYTVSMETGTIEQNKDKIFVTPNSSGDHVFSVNDRFFLINILSGIIYKPYLTDVTASSQQSGGKTLQTLYLKNSDFSSSRISETHLSTQWIVATDKDFVNVIANTTKTEGNLQEVVLEIGEQRPAVFIKTIYNGKTLGSSLWSDVAKYTNPKTLSGTANGDLYGSSIDCSGDGEKIIVGIPGYSTIDEIGSGSVSILRNTGNNYVEEISFSPRNQSASVSLTIPAGGSVRIVLDSTPPFDQTYTATQIVSIPDWGNNGKFYGKGGPGTQYWVPPTAPTPGVGLAAHPLGLPRYVAATYTPQQGASNYPAGLSTYKTAYTIPAQGSSAYPGGLPLYQAAINTPQVGNPSYSSGLPPYKAAINTSQVGNASYPSGLPPYQAAINTPQVGNPSYQSGLPLYQAAINTPQVGNPSYPSGLPPYKAAGLVWAYTTSNPRIIAELPENQMFTFFDLTRDPPTALGQTKFGTCVERAVRATGTYYAYKTETYKITNGAWKLVGFGTEKTAWDTNPNWPDVALGSSAGKAEGTVGYKKHTEIIVNGTKTDLWKADVLDYSLRAVSSGADTGNASYPSGLPPYKAAINTPQVGNPSYPSGLPPYKAAINTPQVGNPSYQSGLPPYQASVYVPQVGNPSYQSGLPPYQASVYVPQVGNASYPNGLPPYQASIYVPQVGNASYPSGLPPYVPASSTPQYGLPAYPNGLPPYIPDTPGDPGYYADASGLTTTVTIQGKSLTFASGFGNTPAVTVEKRIYANSGDSFGSAVAISSNYLYAVAGAPLDEYQKFVDAGSCFAIPYGTNSWLDPIRLAQPTPKSNTNFGTAVDINQNGQVIFVGSPGENAVHVYKNNTHVSTITIPGMFVGSKFGSKVSCSGDGKTVAISSPIEPNGPYQGKVHVFKENPINVWNLINSLTPDLVYETATGDVPEGATFAIEQRDSNDVLLSSHTITDTLVINASTRFIRLTGIGSVVSGYNVIGIRDLDNPIYPPGTWGEDPTYLSEINGLEVFPAFDDGRGGVDSEFTVTYMGCDYKFAYGEKPTQYDIPVIRHVGGFGSSIALSEDGLKLAVGAPNSRIHIENQGFVSYYTFGVKTTEQKFIGAPEYGGYNYGKSVSVGRLENILLITEPGRNAGIGSFDTWTANEFGIVSFRNKTKPNLTIGGGGFGTSSAISLSGEVKVFGNPVDSSNRGSVYVL